ncbi:hypothetical protein QQ045_008360 [Rhodiola kirilowii]
MRCLWLVLLDKLKEEIGTMFLLSGKVISCSCSHIGGHKYAGNLMVYGTDPFGKVTGHWYDLVLIPQILCGCSVVTNAHFCRNSDSFIKCSNVTMIIYSGI